MELDYSVLTFFFVINNNRNSSEESESVMKAVLLCVRGATKRKIKVKRENFVGTNVKNNNNTCNDLIN